MTLIAAIHSGDFAIIASDKMEVVIIDDVVIPCDDEVEKIVNTDIGLITGYGYADLLQAVKNDIANTKISHTEEIINIIQNARTILRNTPLVKHDLKEDILRHTGWIFNYLTIDNGDPRLRLCVYEPSVVEDKICIIPEHSSHIVFPSDINADAADELSKYVKRNFKTDDKTGIEEKIQHNCLIIIQLMDCISQISKSVSKSCDIGVIFRNGSNSILAKNISIDMKNFTFETI